MTYHSKINYLVTVVEVCTLVKVNKPHRDRLLAICQPTDSHLSADSFVSELSANRQLTVSGVSAERW